MINYATRPDWAATGDTIWLDRLREAHADLIEAIEQLAQLTFGPLPDRQVLIDLRWAVSQSSLALFERIKHTYPTDKRGSLAA